METKYKVEHSFNHYYTKEKLYRVKVIYPSGGITYLVLSDEELNNLIEREIR